MPCEGGLARYALARSLHGRAISSAVGPVERKIEFRRTRARLGRVIPFGRRPGQFERLAELGAGYRVQGGTRWKCSAAALSWRIAEALGVGLNLDYIAATLSQNNC